MGNNYFITRNNFVLDRTYLREQKENSGMSELDKPPPLAYIGLAGQGWAGLAHSFQQHIKFS